MASDIGDGAKETADPSVVNEVYLGKRVRALSCDALKPEASATRNRASFSRSKLEGSSWYLVEERDLKTFSKDQKRLFSLGGGF